MGAACAGRLPYEHVAFPDAIPPRLAEPPGSTPSMTAAGFAVFVFAAFLIPVPLLAWLDRPRRGRD